MKDIIVQLVRRFRPTAARVGTFDWLAGAVLGPDEIWPQLELHHRVLILAEAGAGKTFEARGEAERLRAKGKRAFFIRIEAIDDAFPDAFEVGTAAAFEAWLASTEEAWFFLDSVDEAQLQTPAALETALRLFGERVHGGRERAHIYVTSRVDAWEALPDRTLLDQYLPYGEPAAPGHKDKVDNSISASTEEPALGDLKIYRLTALNDDEIRLFAAYHNVSGIKDFLVEIDRRNLRSLAERPFDLRSLIAKWNADRTLGDRFTVFRRVADLHLAELAGPNARALLGSGDALKAVRALAAAVTMTGRNRLSLSETSPAGDRLDPSIILSDWSAEDRDALLRTGIFDDVVFGTVRFRHRDMRELLAAEFFREAIIERGGRDWIEPLFFRTSYGEAVIVPRLRPVLTWLLLLDDPIRARALALEPEIATEGGDPSRLPLGDRRTILSGIVERIAQDKRSGLDNDAIARIAQDDLTADVLTLIERHGADDDVIFFVGRLVWQGQMTDCVPPLFEIARDPARGLYARIASIRAVMTVGSPEIRDALWSALSEESPLDRKLLAEIVGNAAPTLASVERLLEPERSRITEMPMTAAGAAILARRETLASDRLFSAAELRNDILVMEAAYAEFDLSGTEFGAAADFVRRLARDHIERDFWIAIRPHVLRKLFRTCALPEPLSRALVNDDVRFSACLSSYAPFVLVDGMYRTTVTLLSRFMYHWRGVALERNKRYQIRTGFIFEAAVASELREQGFDVQDITRINRHEFDVVTVRDGVIWNVQCKNNFLDLERLEADPGRFGKYNAMLVRGYQRALSKERRREHVLIGTLGNARIEHMLVSRFPVVTDNPRLIPFSRIGQFSDIVDALPIAPSPSVAIEISLP